MQCSFMFNMDETGCSDHGDRLDMKVHIPINSIEAPIPFQIKTPFKKSDPIE
jgi:hypothetical protein